MSTTTENTVRPPRAPTASVALTVAAIVVGLLLAPVTSAAAADPLPPGSYEFVVAAGQVVLDVAPDGGVALTATDGLVVRLVFDDQRRVLDEFTVLADVGTYLVEVEFDEDGSYTAEVEQRADEGDPQDAAGEVVSTVATCAPAGIVARALGLPNHGSIVSAAASGLTLEAEVTDPVTSHVTVVRADFSTVAGAQDFCAQVDAAVPTLDEVRETLEGEAAAARADRANAQEERAAAQALLGRARAAERAAARAAERAAERASRGDEGSPGRSGDDPGGRRDVGTPEPQGRTNEDRNGDTEDRTDGTTPDAAADPGTTDPGSTDGERPATDNGSSDGDSSDGGTTGDDGTDGDDDAAPDHDDDGDDDDGDHDDDDDGGETSPGRGQGSGKGSGKPLVPGAPGKGPPR